MFAFILQNVASSSIHKSRKLNLYNTYRGGQSEKLIVAKLKNDFNEKAKAKTESDFGSSIEWEVYLHGE